MFKSSNGVEMAIEWVMSAHVGEPQALPADDLAASLKRSGHDLTISALRGVIHDMRQRGYLIASSQAGYFIPASLNEALAYVDAQLRVPARDVLQTARRQRQAALEQFGGQMSLFG